MAAGASYFQGSCDVGAIFAPRAFVQRVRWSRQHMPAGSLVVCRSAEHSKRVAGFEEMCYRKMNVLFSHFLWQEEVSMAFVVVVEGGGGGLFQHSRVWKLEARHDARVRLWMYRPWLHCSAKNRIACMHIKNTAFTRKAKRMEMLILHAGWW